MTQDEFDAVVKARIERIESILKSKGDEYARDDRLSNFKNSAALRRTDVLDACGGIAAKQIVSVFDFVEDFRERGVLQPIEAWREKLGDVINYLILMEAIVEELHAERA